MTFRRHGSQDCPHRCSQCQNFEARQVTQSGPTVTVDGDEPRSIETPQPQRDLYSRRRGGKR